MTAHDVQFRITFHGPFHVGSGIPSQGLDRVLDREHLLPATSLKGLMRAAAVERLSLPARLVDAVFGTATGAPNPEESAAGWQRTGSPWSWTDASFTETAIRKAATIHIDDKTGTVTRGFLMLGETVWADEATFEVNLRHTLSDDDLGVHRLVLRAAARGVTGLGGSRHRGEGWVEIVDTDPESEDAVTPWTDTDSSELLAQMGVAERAPTEGAVPCPS